MDTQLINAEIATCAIAGRAANWLRDQARVWKLHIVIVSDRFLNLPHGRHNASHTQMRQWKGSLMLYVLRT